MTRTLASLRTATTEQAERFFAEVPAPALVETLRAASDADLESVVGRPEVRTAAVPGLLGRLDEYAIPSRLAEVKGIVRFDLHDHRRRPLCSTGLEFADGRIELVDAEQPDVVVRTSVVGFLRLIAGQANAGIEYLSGRLDVDGDALLALALGGSFRLPGQVDVPVDPKILEPVAVAGAIAVADPRHLRKVMAGGFREVVLGEIFGRLPDFVNTRKAGRLDLTIGFSLTGSTSGAVERYVVHLADGVATVREGDPGGRRDATIGCDATDFLRLCLGQLSPLAGVLKGQLKVRGDRAKALQFSGVMEIPKAR